MKKIFLSIPYTGVEELSFKLTNYIASKLMEQGHIVLSPISMAHPIVKEAKENDIDIPATFEYWEKVDYSFIDWADTVYTIVISKELTENSIGVKGENEYARSQGKETGYIHLEFKEGNTIKERISKGISKKLELSDFDIIINDELKETSFENYVNI